MSRYVVSLGGNALGNNAEEQKALLVGVAKSIVHLIKLGHEVVIVHGNGPQVGMINLAFTESSSAPDMPFPECGAMSQGYIGFHIQNAIQNELKEQGIKRNVATVVTQVLPVSLPDPRRGSSDHIQQLSGLPSVPDVSDPPLLLRTAAFPEA